MQKIDGKREGFNTVMNKLTPVKLGGIYLIYCYYLCQNGIVVYAFVSWFFLLRKKLQRNTPKFCLCFYKTKLYNNRKVDN